MPPPASIIPRPPSPSKPPRRAFIDRLGRSDSWSSGNYERQSPSPPSPSKPPRRPTPTIEGRASSGQGSVGTTLTSSKTTNFMATNREVISLRPPSPPPARPTLPELSSTKMNPMISTTRVETEEAALATRQPPAASSQQETIQAGAGKVKSTSVAASLMGRTLVATTKSQDASVVAREDRNNGPIRGDRSILSTSILSNAKAGGDSEDNQLRKTVTIREASAAVVAGGQAAASVSSHFTPISGKEISSTSASAHLRSSSTPLANPPSPGRPPSPGKPPRVSPAERLGNAYNGLAR